MAWNEMHYLAKPLTPMKGAPIKGPPGSSRTPLNATEELYRCVKHMANVDAEELGAILCGYWPFEIEKTDNQTVIAGYHRVVSRIRQAIRDAALSEYPTLREGTLWAIEVGLPLVNHEQLRSALSLGDSASGPPQIETSDRDNKPVKRRVNPQWQAFADRVNREDRENDRSVKKKEEVAEMIIEEFNLSVSVATVLRNFNHTGCER